MKLLVKLWALPAFWVFAAQAEAGIFYQSIPDLTIAPNQTDVCSTCPPSSPQWMGEAFMVGAKETATTATFTVGPSYWPTGFTLSIFKSNLGYFFGNYSLDSLVYQNTFASASTSTLLASGVHLLTVNLPSAPTLAPGNYLIFATNPNGLSLPAYYFQSGDGVIVNNQPLAVGDLAQPNFLGPGPKAADWAVALSDSAVPEPSTWILMGLGLPALGIFGPSALRRQRRA